MPFRKGVSGNPNGRPPKTRALSTMLETIMQTQATPGLTYGERTAKALWDFAANGQTTLQDGNPIVATSAQEWFNVVRFIYEHIDGKAQPELATDLNIVITREDTPLFDGD